jgi:hypothetical protein
LQSEKAEGLLAPESLAKLLSKGALRHERHHHIGL